MKNNFIISILLIAVVCLISSCINIKSKYIAPNIYTISQQPNNTVLLARQSINKNIYIKQFMVGDERATSKIVVLEDNKLNYYNYNQWSLPLDELLTDFVVSRFSSYNVFKKGILSSVFSVNPDYILDCKVNKCDIVNQVQQSYLDLNITTSLYIYDYSVRDYQVYSNNYYQKTKIDDFSLEKVSIHLGKMMSEITDNILMDVLDVK